MPGRRGVEDADDLVLHEAEPFGAAPAVAILQEQRLRRGACRDQFGLEQLRHRGAELVLAAGVLFGKCIDRRGDPNGLETIIRFRAGLGYDAVHRFIRYRTELLLSLTKV